MILIAIIDARYKLENKLIDYQFLLCRTLDDAWDRESDIVAGL